MKLGIVLAWVTLMAPAQAGELRSGDVVHYIRDIVQMRYQVPVKDISVVWKDSEPAAKLGNLLDGDKVTYRIQDDVQSSLLGRETVPVMFYSDGHLARTVFFKVRVDAYKTVVVTSARVGLHEAITAQNTRAQRIELDHVPAGVFHNVQSLAGSHARRAMAANTVITQAMVDAEPTIHKGAPVQLQVVNGSLQITTDGVALADGFVGQIVKVQNSANGETVYATVVDARRVRITMEGTSNDQ